jgi:hypothetical protein
MRRSFLNHSSSERGGALVEIAVTLPVMIALLIGTADFARVFYLTIELTNAARAGAQYGAQNLGGAADLTAIEAVAAGSVTTPGVIASASKLCQCALGDGSFPDTVNCPDPPETTCPPATGKFRVITITVTASKLFSTISPYPGIFVQNFNVSRAAVMRVTE